MYLLIFLCILFQFPPWFSMQLTTFVIVLFDPSCLQTLICDWTQLFYNLVKYPHPECITFFYDHFRNFSAPRSIINYEQSPPSLFLFAQDMWACHRHISSIGGGSIKCIFSQLRNLCQLPTYLLLWCERVFLYCRSIDLLGMLEHSESEHSTTFT